MEIEMALTSDEFEFLNIISDYDCLSDYYEEAEKLYKEKMIEVDKYHSTEEEKKHTLKFLQGKLSTFGSQDPTFRIDMTDKGRKAFDSIQRKQKIDGVRSFIECDFSNLTINGRRPKNIPLEVGDFFALQSVIRNNVRRSGENTDTQYFHHGYDGWVKCTPGRKFVAQVVWTPRDRAWGNTYRLIDIPNGQELDSSSMLSDIAKFITTDFVFWGYRKLDKGETFTVKVGEGSVYVEPEEPWDDEEDDDE